MTGPACRAVIRDLGPTTWSVLLDVSFDARPGPDGWTAQTSVRLIADHLGLTPGTAARALGRLRAAGIVQRIDRRDSRSGRFLESVYVIAPTLAARPCVDCPHMAEENTVAHQIDDIDPAERDAGQRLPEGMASVCGSLSGGGRFGRSGGSGLASEASDEGCGRADGGGVAVFGQGPRSC